MSDKDQLIAMGFDPQRVECMFVALRVLHPGTKLSQ